MRATGTVKWFSQQRGFGFIVSETAGRDVFVHYTAIEGDGFRKLSTHDRVEFDMVVGERGPQAMEVRVINDSAPIEPVLAAIRKTDWQLQRRQG